MSFFYLTLDTTAPANPSLLINAGADVTGSQVVQVTLFSSDYGGGSRDVTEMLVWGDVDPTADPHVQTSEGASEWVPFAPDTVVKLAGGDGRKTLYAKLKDDVCNETVAFTDSITLDTTLPVVTITTPVDKSRISKVPGCNVAAFAWEATHEFTHYEIRVVPSGGASHLSGIVVPSAQGSIHTLDDGDFPANTPITTQITGADLEQASPGDTIKLVKVFVRDTSGAWSP